MTHILSPRARVLFYGDDFTGASDNAAQYARHGLRTRLYFTNPGWQTLQTAATDCDVVGVAGTARSLDTSAMTAELLPVLQDFDLKLMPGELYNQWKPTLCFLAVYTTKGQPVLHLSKLAQVHFRPQSQRQINQTWRRNKKINKRSKSNVHCVLAF